MRLCVLLLALFAATVQARGVSPYLPVNLSPEIERKIERVLILAEQPLLKRPIAAATVLDALPRACERDRSLCEDVRRYLTSLTRTAGISYGSVSIGGGTGADTPLPNRHGMSSQSNYEAAAALYWQPGDHLLVTAGALAYDGDTNPTGSVVSIGSEYLQIDVGYRDRWWSPSLDNAMLLSTQAQTLPSVTISNYTPFTRAKLRYEAFLGELSESANIAFGAGTTTGKPRIAGLQLSVEPLEGWSIGVSRIMQYGGGERDDSLRDLFDAFFNPSERDNTGPASTGDFGNQAASFTSQFVLGDPLPIAVYFEYAGEDTSRSNNFRLGNSALSAGITFPQLGANFAATFEVTEWQNGWYAHHIYRDGLRNDGRVLGHWGGDWRALVDEVGAHSLFARVTWTPAFGTLEASYRQLDNEQYGNRIYETARQIDARYSRPWDQVFVGAELTLGRDVFGESYSRLGAFIRF
ncbi:MAG TPA: capsule assembly Wzi family protein [Gammaproteobacteria bacterium]|nr:capsule assembly Wzi family protein [Gammaproteobacteria bacterium]